MRIFTWPLDRADNQLKLRPQIARHHLRHPKSRQPYCTSSIDRSED